MTKCSDLIREEENFPGGQIDTIQPRELDPMLPLRLRLFFATSSPLPSQIHWRTLYAASIQQGAIPIVHFAVQVPCEGIGGSRQPRELKKLDKDHR